MFPPLRMISASAWVSPPLSEAEGSAYEDASVRHLLDMTVGVSFDEDYLANEGMMIRYREASGWKPRSDPSHVEHQRDFVLTLNKDGEHGDAFHYVSPNTDLLGWVIERAADVDYATVLEHEIWQPMGAEFDAYITVDRVGAPRTAGGLCATLRDLARFGQMMLQHGLSDGRTVVPAWWVDDIRTAGDRDAWRKGNFADFFPDGRYRSKWYQVGNDRGSFCAIGVYGQHLYVDPAADVVIAQFASHPLPLDDAAGALSAAMFEAVTRTLDPDRRER